MTGLRVIFTLALALYWVGATSHCMLERLTGFEFLSCCQHEEADQTPGHEKEDCSDDSCTVVEAGFYKVQDNDDLVPNPEQISVAFFLDVVSALNRAVTDSRGEVLRAALPPPTLQPSWQFSCRAAAPVRAPSSLA